MADDEGESNSCDQITEYQYIKKDNENRGRKNFGK